MTARPNAYGRVQMPPLGAGRLWGKTIKPKHSHGRAIATVLILLVLAALLVPIILQVGFGWDIFDFL